MSFSIVGGGGSVNLQSSPWSILEGPGVASPSPVFEPGKESIRTLKFNLLIAGGSADGIQTAVRNVEQILEYAREQERGRHGYPDSFVGALDCYLDFAPTGLTTGGHVRILNGALNLEDDWYAQPFWQRNYAKATLTIKCRPYIEGTEATGTKTATALTSQPFAIATTDNGGNSGIAPAPIRLGIHISSVSDPIKTVYGAIYPNLGTFISPILNSGSVASAAALLNGDYNTGTVTSTTYVACGTVTWTTDGKPKRYFVIIKRRANGTAPLNWRLQTAGGAVVSDVWADDSPPANAWAGLAAGQLTYPNQGLTGTTGGGGTPNTFSNTIRVMAARQSGSGTVIVDTDFIALIPMDAGSYFVAKDNASPAVLGGGATDWLHVYNDDEVLRASIASGPPGGTVATISANGVVYSGRPLPTMWPGANRVVLVGITNSGSVEHTFNPDLQWTIKPRTRSL